MAFSRKFLADHGVPEDQIDAIMAERNRTLVDYVPKSDVQTQIDEALKGVKPPEINVKEAQEYKDLESQFTDFKARTEAKTSDAWKGVKPKFFDTVYDRIDREKDIAEQLENMRKDYEEYFVPGDTNEPPATNLPVFSQVPGRTNINPQSSEETEASKFISALMDNLPGVKRKE